jgi:hypothetical protein
MVSRTPGKGFPSKKGAECRMFSEAATSGTIRGEVFNGLVEIAGFIGRLLGSKLDPKAGPKPLSASNLWDQCFPHYRRHIGHRLIPTARDANSNR